MSAPVHTPPAFVRVERARLVDVDGQQRELPPMLHLAGHRSSSDVWVIEVAEFLAWLGHDVTVTRRHIDGGREIVSLFSPGPRWFNETRTASVLGKGRRWKFLSAGSSSSAGDRATTVFGDANLTLGLTSVVEEFARVDEPRPVTYVEAHGWDE